MSERVGPCPRSLGRNKPDEERPYMCSECKRKVINVPARVTFVDLDNVDKGSMPVLNVVMVQGGCPGQELAKLAGGTNFHE